MSQGVILPGATLGVMGGGQLGRMFVHAAQGMGYATAVLDADPTSPAGLVSHTHIQTAYLDADGLARMSTVAAAVTTEFENVPAQALDTLAATRPVAPSGAAVSVCQDRAREKAHFTGCGVPCAPHALIDSPEQLAAVPDRGLGWLAAAGGAAWAIGFAFESIGDWQLARFKADPSNTGKVLDSGLWRYTRHPNYFGDFMVWWGIFLIAAESGAGAWGFIGPILMTVLLVKVSGAGLLEKDIAQRRPGYAEYVRRTSGFFPRPPRSD